MESSPQIEEDSSYPLYYSTLFTVNLNSTVKPDYIHPCHQMKNKEKVIVKFKDRKQINEKGQSYGRYNLGSRYL